MKSLYPLVPVLMFFSGLAFIFAGETQKQEQKLFEMRPTHEALQARQDKVKAKQANQQQVIQRVARPVVAEEKEGPGSTSLIDRSAVLSSGRNWTIVPKGAVLHIPDRYSAYVNGKKAGKLVPWKTFYSQNRGWIHVHSVTMAQARGEEKMDPKQVEAYQSFGRIVVSVCHGGPISVIPPKKDASDDVDDQEAEAADGKNVPVSTSPVRR